MTRRLKVFLGLAVAAGLAVLAVAAFWLVPAVRHALAVQRHLRESAVREPAILAEWTERFGDPKTLEVRFPPSPDDSLAIELAGRAKELGIDLHAPYPPEPGGPLHSPEDLLFGDVGKYVRAQIERASGDVEAPASPVCEYLDRHRPAIEEIAEFLTRSDPPRWEAAPAWLLGPVPNLLGHRRLQHVLTADALALSLAGDHEAAERRLLAAWNLNASLRDRTDFISQMIAVANARMHAGVARWIVLEDPAWEERLRDHDYRESMLRALAVQAAAGGCILAGESVWARGSRADYYRINADFLEKLEKATLRDSVRGSVIFEERPEHALSAGGILAPMGFPNAAYAVRKADRLALETELTLKVLEAKRARQRKGRWPERLLGVETSILGEPHWLYSVEGRRVRMRLSAPFEWKDWSGFGLPFEFSSD